MAYIAKFIKTGNIKVGPHVWTFNKLAGNSVIAGCKGSCGKYCKGCWNEEHPKESTCYVTKSYRTYGWEESSPVQSHIKNTVATRENLAQSFKDLELQLKRARKKPAAIRVHASGELETVKELREWLSLAKQHPNIPFYIYTKAYRIVDKVLSSTPANELPKNFYINISVWHKSGISCYNKWQHLDNIRAFVYNDGTYNYEKQGLKVDCKCPAYDDKGKMNHDLTCEVCGICFNKKAKVCLCNSH